MNKQSMVHVGHRDGLEHYRSKSSAPLQLTNLVKHLDPEPSYDLATDTFSLTYQPGERARFNIVIGVTITESDKSNELSLMYCAITPDADFDKTGVLVPDVAVSIAELAFHFTANSEAYADISGVES